MPSHVQSSVRCMQSNHACLLMRPYVFITCILIMSSPRIHMPPLHAFQSCYRDHVFDHTLHIMFELQVFNSHRLIPGLVFSLYAFILTSYACHSCIPLISRVIRHPSSIFMHIHIFISMIYFSIHAYKYYIHVYSPSFSRASRPYCFSSSYYVNNICFSSFILYTFTYIKTFIFSLHWYMHFIYTGV